MADVELLPCVRVRSEKKYYCIVDESILTTNLPLVPVAYRYQYIIEVGICLSNARIALASPLVPVGPPDPMATIRGDTNILNVTQESNGHDRNLVTMNGQ
jgi:hypothetical protein